MSKKELFAVGNTVCSNAKKIKKATMKLLVYMQKKQDAKMAVTEINKISNKNPTRLK